MSEYDDAAVVSETPENVIKGFAQASETTLLFSDTLKLHLADKSGTAINPFTEILDQEMFNLLEFPHILPEHTRSFVLWQKNVVALDITEIAAIETPKGYRFKYDVKGARLEQMHDDEQRHITIKNFLDEQEEYFQQFNEVRATLEAIEERFIAVDDMLVRAQAIDEEVAPRLDKMKKRLEEMRIKLCDIRAVLEDNALPDVPYFKQGLHNIKGLMLELSELNLNIRDCIQKHRLRQDEE